MSIQTIFRSDAEEAARDGWRLLAAAVIAQAYRDLRRKGSVAESAREFFDSEWSQILQHMSGVDDCTSNREAV